MNLMTTFFEVLMKPKYYLSLEEIIFGLVSMAYREDNQDITLLQPNAAKFGEGRN